MSITLESKQCIIAGNGELPVQAAKGAKENGFEVIAISLSCDNRKQLQKYCSKVYVYGPGQIKNIKQTLLNEKIKQLTFIGKVHKGLLLQHPFFDSEALELLKKAKRLNDDAVMLLLVEELEKLGVTVLDQTIFIKNMMVPHGILGKYKPSPEQEIDISYGYHLAKEMGKLDVGQSVVVKNKMIMAAEAIEGTDCCIKRGCKYAKKGAVVVKVSKPTQDKRFDIPTVGLKTLKMLHRYNGALLAIEAGETIIVNQKAMIDYANKHKIVLIAV